MNKLTYSLEYRKSLAILIIDIFAIGFVMFLPAISHLLPIPIYYIDPMRLVLFTVYFINKNHKNAYILALGLPIFSMFYSGHPIFYKAILISIELFINIVLIHQLSRRGFNIFIAVFLGIVLSKVLYYFFKFIFIKWSLISGELFSTNLFIQIAIALGISLVFYFFTKAKFEKSVKK